MGKGNIKFGNIAIEKDKFHHRKNLILLEDLDIDNMQVSRTVSLVKKSILSATKIVMIIKLNHYA